MWARSNALGVAEILDRDGNAVKWPTISSCLNLLESRAGVCQSMFAHDGGITLQPGLTFAMRSNIIRVRSTGDRSCDWIRRPIFLYSGDFAGRSPNANFPA